MSKYHITDVPMHKPGKCGNCGASKNDGRKYLDFGLEIEWYGTFYLCGFCLEDTAKQIGLFTKLEMKIVELELTLGKIQGLQEKGVELHETVVKTFKEFEEFYGSLHSSGNYSPSDITPNVGTSETASKQDVDESESTVIKPPSGTRRTNIRSLADLAKE